MARSSTFRVMMLVLGRGLICLVLLVVAGAILGGLIRSKPVPARSDRASEPVRVPVLLARQVEVTSQWTGYGTARALDSADVPARVTATVRAIPSDVEAGLRVRADQLLVQLDDTDFARRAEIAAQAVQDLDAKLEEWDIQRKAAGERVETATAQVRLAEAEFERVRGAIGGGGAIQQDLDVAQRAVNAAKDSLTVARTEYDRLPPQRASTRAQRARYAVEERIALEDVGRCRITSPIDGVIEVLDVELGENVTSGTRVARVVGTNRVEIPLRVPARARGDLAPGDAVLLTTSDPDGPSWTSTVTRLSPVDDEATRTTVAYVEVEMQDDTESRLAPGTFVRGTVTSGRVLTRSVVPRRALDGDRIFVIEDGVLTARVVEIEMQVDQTIPELGLQDRAWAVLRDPLPDGTQVVITATRALDDGRSAVGVTTGPTAAKGNTP